MPQDLDLPDLLDRLRTAPSVTVVVSAGDDGPAVRRARESVLAHTSGARVVTDHTGTPADALALAGADDVVLLAADAEVGPLWLQRLRWVAYSRPGVASVTAAATSATVPHLAWAEVARLAAAGPEPWAVEQPAGDGCCRYLTRSGDVHLLAPHVLVRHPGAEPVTVPAAVRAAEVLPTRLYLRADADDDVALATDDLVAALSDAQHSLVVADPDPATLAALVVDHAVEVVHVQLGSPSYDDSAAAAQLLGVPVIASAHDLPTGPSFALDASEAVVFPSTDVAARLADLRPDVAPRVAVIEPGRDTSAFRPARADERHPGPFRVLAPAAWSQAQRLDDVRELAGLVGPRVEWHFLGAGSEQLADVGVAHGDYTRFNLGDLTAAIDPDVIGLFPQATESLLTEAWGMGVPVVATDLGTARTRIADEGGGRLLPLAPDAAADILLELVSDPEALAAARRTVASGLVRDRLSAANDHRALYERSQLAPPTLGIISPGRPDQIGPTAHIRAYRRARAAAQRGLLRAERVVATDYAHGRTPDRYDALLLVRNALRPNLAEPVLARARANGVRVVLDLDDDLITDHAVDRLAASGWDAAELATLRQTVTRVDSVLVSTPALAALVGELHDDVVCRPNELDPRLWSRRVDTEPSPRDDVARVLYMGSATHAADLALLSGVTGAVSARLGREVVLEIVGVSAPGTTPGVRRLRPARTDYPGFVTWLREQAPRWRAGVAPLVDTDFNRCKSDLKLVEYALLGLPSVASDVGPYVGSGLTRLTANTSEGWASALAEAIEDGPAAEAAAAHVRSNRMLGDRAVEAWVEEVLGRRP